MSLRSMMMVMCLAGLTFGCTSVQSGGIETSSGMVTLKAVDFMGGDLKHLKTPSGADECAKACSKMDNCHAFTYAQPSHKLAKKHHSCWLKKKGFRYNRSPHYISGIKP